ncbi:hypothetical protein ACT3SP_09030 [Brachybacterium sp. AOP43-C2-M15]
MRPLVVVTVIALLAVALPWILLRHEGPEEVVEKYLQALIDGDGAAVREHMSPLEGALGTALSDAVLAATRGGIADFTIDRVHLRGTAATVVVTLRSEREEHRTVLALSARAVGPFAPVVWEMAPVQFPTLNVSPLTGTDALIINGQRLAIPEVEYTERGANRVGVVLQVLPGSYTIELPPAQPPLVSRTRVVEVPPVLGRWYSGLIDVDYGLTPSAEAQVRSTIRSEIRDCARSTSPRPAGCPFFAALPAGTIGTWTVTELPEIAYTGMFGDVFRFQGKGLVAEYTVRVPAPEGGAGEAPTATTTLLPVGQRGEGSRAEVGRVEASAEAGDVLVTSTLFGTSITLGPDGYELTDWHYAATRLVVE